MSRSDAESLERGHAILRYMEDTLARLSIGTRYDSLLRLFWKSIYGKEPEKRIFAIDEHRLAFASIQLHFATENVTPARLRGCLERSATVEIVASYMAAALVAIPSVQILFVGVSKGSVHEMRNRVVWHLSTIGIIVDTTPRVLRVTQASGDTRGLWKATTPEDMQYLGASGDVVFIESGVMTSAECALNWNSVSVCIF